MGPALLRYLAGGLWLLFQIRLAAQGDADPHRVDAPLARFSEHQRKDSFLYYAREKIRLSRQSDSLALWAWTYLDIHDFLSGQGETDLQSIDAALQQRWRELAGPAEWEPFLYLQASRGWLTFQSGNVLQAVRDYEEAARIYERFRYPDLDVVEEVYKPLGNHYTRLGDNEKALAVFQKALNIGGDNETLAGLYSNIGTAYWNQGEFDAAILHFRRGMDLTGISPAKSALLYAGLAQVMLDAGDARQAYSLSLQALHYLQRGDGGDAQAPAYRVRVCRTAGAAALSLGQFGEARRLLGESLAGARKAFGRISRDLGKIETTRARLFEKTGNAPAALEAANRALSAVLPAFRPEKPGDNPAAGDLYEEITLAEALDAKAAAAVLMSQKDAATAWLQCALDCYDLAWQAEATLRRVYQYSSSRLQLQKNARLRAEAALNVARLLFEKTGQPAYLDRAFAIAERSKATLLLEALQEHLVRQKLAGADERFRQVAALRQSLAYFEKNLLLDPAGAGAPQWRAEADALAGRLAVLEQALGADYPQLGEVGTVSGAPPTAADLAEGEILAEYFAGEHFIDCFVFQKNRPGAWYRFPNDTSLRETSRRFLSCFENAGVILHDPAGYLAAAWALFQKIIPPLPPGLTRLTIVPDGFLHFVPFEALVTAAPGNEASLRRAAYLIRQQEIRYAWSLEVLRRQNRLSSNAGRAMLVVAPGFEQGERGLAPLPAKRSEWEAMDGGAMVLEGARAGLSGFLAEAPQYRVLHFSTHAFAGDRPRIELYDQPLYLPDIYATALQADLVVLSACESGLGRERKGEGVMSLARAFGQAGAATVVSSLWAVNDRSTAAVMRRFYNNLGAGYPVSQSLRAAKLEYLDDPAIGPAMQTPYFWAGLVSVGAGRQVTGCEPAAGLKGGVKAGLFVTFFFIFLAIFVHRRYFQCKNRSKPTVTK